MNIRKTDIEREKQTVELMIRIYCKHKEGNKTLCENCSDLLQYAQSRLTNCPFGTRKTTCKKCKIHCYSKVMRQRMRLVMRYSGPRMMLFHPGMALTHLWREMVS